MLKLPAELRNRIYELVVVEDEPVNIYGFLNFNDDGTPYIRFRQPALTATCWQIRIEGKQTNESCPSYTVPGR